MTAGQAITAGDERRPDAILAFLGAGLFQRLSRAQAVNAIAAARRGVAACQARRAPVRQWLAGAYAREHPDRLPALQSMLTVLT